MGEFNDLLKPRLSQILSEEYTSPFVRCKQCKKKTAVLMKPYPGVGHIICMSVVCEGVTDD